MISRVAECCFWLHRYVERADDVARLLRVNRSFVLDVKLPALERWRPVVVVSGEEERLSELLGDEAADDSEMVQEYLTWNSNNPISLMTSVRWARENARTIREAISLEMWESLNAFYLWMKSKSARHLYTADRDEFYLRVRDAATLFLGSAQQTVLHDQGYAFMQLGVYLERAGQTARILDVKHRALHRTGSPASAGTKSAESAIESAQSMALLRSCSAIEPYFKRRAKTYVGRSVANFLYGEVLFPRSVLFCLKKSSALIASIRSETGETMGASAASEIGELVASIEQSIAAGKIESDLHGELTRVIDKTAKICATIHSDFFDPTFDNLMSTSQKSEFNQAQIQS